MNIVCICYLRIRVSYHLLSWYKYESGHKGKLLLEVQYSPLTLAPTSQTNYSYHMMAYKVSILQIQIS